MDIYVFMKSSGKVMSMERVEGALDVLTHYWQIKQLRNFPSSLSRKFGVLRLLDGFGFNGVPSYHMRVCV